MIMFIIFIFQIFLFFTSFCRYFFVFCTFALLRRILWIMSAIWSNHTRFYTAWLTWFQTGLNHYFMYTFVCSFVFNCWRSLLVTGGNKFPFFLVLRYSWWISSFWVICLRFVLMWDLESFFCCLPWISFTRLQWQFRL